MNRVTVSLPNGIYSQLRRLARREGVSVNQYVTFAIAKQVEQVNTAPIAVDDWSSLSAIGGGINVASRTPRRQRHHNSN